MKLMPPSMAASTALQLSFSFVVWNTLPSNDAPKHSWDTFIPVFPISVYLMIDLGFYVFTQMGYSLAKVQTFMAKVIAFSLQTIGQN